MSRASSAEAAYQFRVWVRGIRPTIWRRFLVRSDSTIADLFPRRASPFPTRLFGALHQTTGGDKILHTRKARDVRNLIQNDQGQNLPDPGHGLRPGKRLHLMRFGTAGNIEFRLAEQFVIVIDEGDLDFY